MHSTPQKIFRHTPPKAENLCKNSDTTQNEAKKGPSGRQRPPPLPPGGVGAFEYRFPGVEQHRTHTSTRGGSRVDVPKVRRKAPPNAHPRPGLDARTMRKNVRKYQKSARFGVRVSAIEMTSPSARFGREGRDPRWKGYITYSAIAGREKEKNDSSSVISPLALYQRSSDSIIVTAGRERGIRGKKHVEKS